jgi:hypothetical protein
MLSFCRQGKNKVPVFCQVLDELTYDMFSVLHGSGSSSFGYGLAQPAILD